MGRFYGEVGYGISVEDPPLSGVWVDSIAEYTYTGDVVRNIMRSENDDKLNNDILVNNSVSIIADQYAMEHFFNIKYVRWEGVLWAVSSVEVRRPRLVLNLGSVYNGPTP